MDADSFRSIQLLALNSAENPDFEAFYRKVCRWYSREFSTPLKSVLDFDEEHVLRTYFEDKYTAMQPNQDDKKQMEEYTEFRTRLILGPDAVSEAESEEDDWAAEMAEQMEQEEKEYQQLKSKRQQSNNDENPNLINELDEHEDVNMSSDDRWFPDDDNDY